MDKADLRSGRPQRSNRAMYLAIFVIALLTYGLGLVTGYFIPHPGAAQHRKLAPPPSLFLAHRL